MSLAKSQAGLAITEDMATLRKLEQDLLLALSPLFDDELAFYEQLSDILKRSLMGQTLSDSSRHLFSTEHPFP